MTRAKTAPYVVPPGHVLALRVCAAGGVSWDGFQWPTEAGGYVEPRSWDPLPICGYGLHGWLWGAGDIRAASEAVYLSPDSLWYVLEIAAVDMVQVTESGGGMVKCRRCRVVFVGARDEAVKLIAAHAPPGTVALFDTGTATAGYRGTATAGDGGTATAGDGGTATAGYMGTATAGDGGTATAGDRGTATAGDRGTATAGDGGTAAAGYRGTATVGEGGCISIRWWDGDSSRYRIRSGDVGAKETLKPGVKYRLNSKGEFEEAFDQSMSVNKDRS